MENTKTWNSGGRQIVTVRGREETSGVKCIDEVIIKTTLGEPRSEWYEGTQLPDILKEIHSMLIDNGYELFSANTPGKGEYSVSEKKIRQLITLDVHYGVYTKKTGPVMWREITLSGSLPNARNTGLSQPAVLTLSKDTYLGLPSKHRGISLQNYQTIENPTLDTANKVLAKVGLEGIVAQNRGG